MQIECSFGLFIFDLEQMLGLRCNGVAFNCLVNFSAFLFGRRLSNCIRMQTMFCKAAEAEAIAEEASAFEAIEEAAATAPTSCDSNKWTNAKYIHVNQINFLVDVGRYFISACERVRCSCVYLSDRACTSFFNAMQRNTSAFVCRRFSEFRWQHFHLFCVFCFSLAVQMYIVQNVSR